MDKRSKKVVKNIAGSFFIKGWAGVVQLLLVPVTIGCLGKYEYGIWMTLSSVLLWMDSFDMGLGNGLRNKLAEFVAREQWTEARQAVSTTFFLLICLILPLVLLLLVLAETFDVAALLNLERGSVAALTETVQVSLFFVGLTLVLKFLGNVYLGLQLPAINNLLVVAGQTLGLLGILVFDRASGRLTLFHAALIFTFAPVLVYAAAYPVTFRLYPRLTPGISFFRRSMVRELFTMGLNFFVLQMAGLVLFFTSNLLITRILGAAEVTPYQVAFRYFSFANMLFSIIVTPLWSATTDAYAKHDFAWIRTCTSRMRKLLLGFVLLLLLMTWVSPFAYGVWVGKQVEVPFTLSALMGLYTAVILYSLYYAHILFGIGHIRLQMYVTLGEALVFIPLAICGAHRFGVEGIVGALILVNIACAVSNRLQYAKIMSGRATGIWIK